MTLDELQSFAKKLGYFIGMSESLTQARALILASAVEFKNLA